MLPDRVSNPGPLTYESGALSIALHGPAPVWVNLKENSLFPSPLGEILSVNGRPHSGNALSSLGHVFIPMIKIHLQGCHLPSTSKFPDFSLIFP